MTKGHRRSGKRHRSSESSSSPSQWSGQIYGLELLGQGLSGMVFAIDGDTVFKLGVGSEKRREGVKIEQIAYNILDRQRKAGKYSRYVLRRVSDDPRGLILERCKETLRDRLNSPGYAESRSEQDINRWALQAADGLAFLHYCEIIQGDVGCHNMLLAKHKEEDDVRICDFAGSSVEGSEATVAYEPWSLMPGTDEPTLKSEIFALGSAIYEMSTGKPPYYNKTPSQIRSLYKNHCFPSTHNVYLGAVIDNCWRGVFSTVEQVIKDIDEGWTPSHHRRAPPKLSRKDSNPFVSSIKPQRPPTSTHRRKSHSSRSSNPSVINGHRENERNRQQRANEFGDGAVRERDKTRKDKQNTGSRFGLWIKNPFDFFSHSYHRSS